MMLLIEARDKNLPSLTVVDEQIVEQSFLDGLDEKTELLIRVQPMIIGGFQKSTIEFEKYNPATKQWETI